MKRIIPLLFALLVFFGVVFTMGLLVYKAQDEPVVFTTAKPTVADIVKKTVATGSIVPRTEVALKSRVSGVVDELFLEPGSRVEAGDPIARIRIIPDSVTLNNAESSVQSARISYNDAKRDLDRAEQLFAQGAISAAEADQARTTADLRQQDLSQAIANLELVRDGATRRQRDVSTVVQATVSGMVLEVPVEVGQSVIESNTFNEGTTIAAVADMSDLVFEGFVDESEVGRIREGMELSITIGALNDLPFKGTLEYIAPKGLVDQGTVKFEIRAALTAQSEVFVRAGLSANADIVLDRRDQVLAISERLLQFEGKTPYVEVETRSQVFERRDVQTGLSDGMNIEVLSGVTADDAIKVPQG